MQQVSLARPVELDQPVERSLRAAAAPLWRATALARRAIATYLDGLEHAFDQRALAIDERFAHESAQARCALDAALQSAQAAFEESDAQVRRRLAGLVDAAPWAVLQWDAPQWTGYTPPPVRAGPLSVRVGRLILPGSTPPACPALVGLVERGHLFLHAGDTARPEAIDVLRAVLLRLLVSAAPGTVHLVLADAYSAGSSLSVFRRLPDALRGAKIWVSPQEIEARLYELVARIESVVQTRLVTPGATIEDYNLARPEQRLPYVILGLADFPAGFNDRMAELLLTIARNGPRAGVYLAAHLNPSSPAPRNLDVQALTALGTLLRVTGPARASWDDPIGGAYDLVPDRLPAIEMADRLLGAVGAAAERSQPDFSFGRIATAQQERWRGSTVDGIEAPIGLGSLGEPHLLRLGQDPGVVHHGLIGGASGSGKGNMLHVLITQLALRYPPEELGLYLLDFKEGVEFQRYTSLPQARAVGLESEREFGLNVLRSLQAEMEERGRLFKSLGAGVGKFADYRRQSGKPLARLILIIDEFQVLFREDDAVARDAAQLLEDLAKRGRSAAIHVLLCSQSPSTGSYLLTRVYDQMGLRIALQCRQRDALAILGEGNDAAAHLERVGEAIYNDRMGDRDKNHLIRVAHLGEREWPEALDAVRLLAGSAPYPPAFTFDGHAPAVLTANPAFAGLLAAPAWPPRAAQVRFWLGDPIDLKTPTEATFERYPRSNLLIAGDNEAQAMGLLLAALLAVAAQCSPDAASFYLVDPTRPGGSQIGLAATVTQWEDAGLPHPLEVAGPREAAGLIAGLVGVLKERQAATGPTGPACYLFLAGLHRWRDLRGPDSITQSETAKQVLRLVEEGPEVGIHTIAWADSLAIVEQALKRNGQRHFDLRVALRLSSRDSGELLGSSAAAALEDNRALFRHEDWEAGRREKFKPYVAPEHGDLERILRALHTRTGHPEQPVEPHSD